MCGIAGIYNQKSAIAPDDLRNMARTMHHRGPDSTGYYVSRNGMIGLAHNRLSIIDLSESANQPLSNEDKSIWLVFNGEIYNFQGLRDSLIRRGHLFKCHSDSEVILHLYEEEGIRSVNALNGMFAFCILDERSNNLYLVRDRVGIKPLYFYNRNGLFAFSSELKALLALPQISRNLDLQALDFYFTLGYIPEDLSIIQDIQKLRPGYWLKHDGSDIQVANYWDLKSIRHDLGGYNQQELVDLLEEILRDSVKKQMVSDVPIGCFLSGGIDSSLVATMMAQESNEPIHTFTIGFDSARHDETPQARLVANKIGAIHKECFIQMDAAKALEKLVHHFDEPFADSSLIPTFYVSQAARDHVTVVLSGDGGDELFAGYNWYTWVMWLEHLKKRAGSWDQVLVYLGKLLPQGSSLRRVFSSLRLGSSRQFLERLLFFNSAEKTCLYRNELQRAGQQKDGETRFLDFFSSIEGDLIKKMTLTDFYYYLPEDILAKVDRASMAVSLETRVPWLDHQLVEFAYSLPSDKRIHGTCKKYLPKKLAKKILPPRFPLDRKRGFCIPLNQWMKGKLGAMLEDELKNKFPGEFLNADYVWEILERHRNNIKSPYGHKLFSILVFSMWAREYLINS